MHISPIFPISPFLIGCALLVACADGDDGAPPSAAGSASASGGAVQLGSGGATDGAPGAGGEWVGVGGRAELASGGAAPASGGAEPSAGGTNTSAGGSADHVSVFPPDVTRPKLMIVGDSISAGPGCYKGYLDEALEDDGFDYEFVGEHSDDCGSSVRHSAVSCTTSLDFTKDNFSLLNCSAAVHLGMSPLVEKHQPDLIMIQLGVNDVWSGDASVSGILSNYSTLLAQARAHNPKLVFVVAQIHKIITDDCTNEASTDNAQELVMAVPEWAAMESTEMSPVFVADLWTNSDPHEADDCVHPNDAGARRMALNWFYALSEILPRQSASM